MNKIEELKNRLEELKNLEEGWDDGYGSKIDLKTIKICEDLLSHLYQYNFVPKFSIFPLESTKGIQTEFCKKINSKKFLSLDIYFIPEENKIECYCLESGKEEKECEYNMDSIKLKDQILNFIKQCIGE